MISIDVIKEGKGRHRRFYYEVNSGSDNFISIRKAPRGGKVKVDVFITGVKSKMRGTFLRHNGTLGCHHTGKTAFKSKEEAETRLIEIRFSCKTVLCRVYRCPNCKHWHLTSDQNRRKTVK